jgi:hypothetical protein
MFEAIKIYNSMLLDLEKMAKIADDKTLRRKICYLMHRISQILARLRDELNQEIESRR